MEPKLHYHKTSPMNNILSHLTSVHTHTPYNFKIPFNIIILSMSGVSVVPSLCNSNINLCVIPLFP